MNIDDDRRRRPVGSRGGGNGARAAYAPAPGSEDGAASTDPGLSGLSSQTDERRGGREADGEEGSRVRRFSATSNLSAEERWQAVQSTFVDDPQRAVGEADELVCEEIAQTVQRIQAVRDDVAQRWRNGGAASTEDLRQCLQRYRDLSRRLHDSKLMGRGRTGS